MNYCRGFYSFHSIFSDKDKKLDINKVIVRNMSKVKPGRENPRSHDDENGYKEVNSRKYIQNQERSGNKR